MKIFNGWSDKNLVGIILVFIFLGFSIFLINDLGNRALSGARAYIAGEGEWTKAQKKASLALVRYLHSENEELHNEFLEYLDVSLGDKLAREELESDNPDYELVYSGFIQGNNHPEDISHLIWLYRYASGIEPVHTAIEAWKDGDRKIEEFIQLGEEIRQTIQEQELTEEQRVYYMDQIYLMDDEFSDLQAAFSLSMTEAAQKVSAVVYWFTILVGLLLILAVGFITVTQLRALNSVNKKLRATDQKFRSVLNNSRDLIYQMDLQTGEYEYVSPSVEDILGYSIEEVKEGGVTFFLDKTHPEDTARLNEQIKSFSSDDIEEKLKLDHEFRVKSKSGNYIWVDNQRSFIKDEDGAPVAIVGNVRDISDKMKYIDVLDSSLNEKKMLLSEVHHRVKNNLSIISSLIEIQKASMDLDGEDPFKDIQARIKSIALIHEKLYQTDSLADINLSEYITELSAMIAGTYKTTDSDVVFKNKMDHVEVNISQAVTVGLISNELISNCYKHAFKGRVKGEIVINLEKSDSGVVLSVKDDGIGLPKNFDMDKQDSLGMTLLNALTQQLDGKLSVESGDHTIFKVEFKPKSIRSTGS